jgi:hypothetical protein
MSDNKNFWRAFLDFFVLFNGVSTISNLSRTRKTPIVGRGLFLFRQAEKPTDAPGLAELGSERQPKTDV